MKRWAVFLLGGGLGLTAGAGIGDEAALPGLAIAVLGLLLLVFGRRSGSPGPAGDAPESPDAKPSLSHLGQRVEQILKLAQTQADDHRSQAKIDADRILAEAREEAGRILAAARGEAGRRKPDDTPSE